jgi:predicted nucleic acid-binding Zn ribbon protein
MVEREGCVEYYTITTMLFHKKTQKAAKMVWMVICVLVIVSMILLYAPIFR